MQWPPVGDTRPHKYKIDFAPGMPVTREDVEKCMRDTPVTQDNCAERAKAYEKLCEPATDLYRGTWPMKVHHMQFILNKTLSALKDSWRGGILSEDEVDGEWLVATRWANVQAAEIILNPGLVSTARTLGNHFMSSIFELGFEMATRNTAVVRRMLPDMLKLNFQSESLNSFLRYDRNKNDSKFFEALITHFASEMDPSLNHIWIGEPIVQSTDPHASSSYAPGYTPQVLRESPDRVDALVDFFDARRRALLYPYSTSREVTSPPSDSAQADAAGNTGRTSQWEWFTRHFRRKHKDGRDSSS